MAPPVNKDTNKSKGGAASLHNKKKAVGILKNRVTECIYLSLVSISRCRRGKVEHTGFGAQRAEVCVCGRVGNRTTLIRGRQTQRVAPTNGQLRAAPAIRGSGDDKTGYIPRREAHGSPAASLAKAQSQQGRLIIPILPRPVVAPLLVRRLRVCNPHGSVDDAVSLHDAPSLQSAKCLSSQQR